MRAQILYDGGSQLWDDFMNELREHHLGILTPDTGRPSVGEQLDATYAEAIEAAKQNDRTA